MWNSKKGAERCIWIEKNPILWGRNIHKEWVENTEKKGKVGDGMQEEKQKKNYSKCN